MSNYPCPKFHCNYLNLQTTHFRHLFSSSDCAHFGPCQFRSLRFRHFTCSGLKVKISWLVSDILLTHNENSRDYCVIRNQLASLPTACNETAVELQCLSRCTLVSHSLSFGYALSPIILLDCSVLSCWMRRSVVQLVMAVRICIIGF